MTLNASRDHLLRSHPSTGSILHDESWCISKANNCKSWLTNHRRFNFTTRNVQTSIHASLCAFGIVTPNFRVPPNLKGIYNSIKSYKSVHSPIFIGSDYPIRQYFTPSKQVFARSVYKSVFLSQKISINL